MRPISAVDMSSLFRLCGKAVKNASNPGQEADVSFWCAGFLPIEGFGKALIDPFGICR